MNHKLIGALLIATTALPAIATAGNLDRDIIRRVVPDKQQAQTPASASPTTYGPVITVKPKGNTAAETPANSVGQKPQAIGGGLDRDIIRRAQPANKQGDGSKVDNPAGMGKSNTPHYGPVITIKPKG